MNRMGRKELTIELQAPIDAVPELLVAYALQRSEDGTHLTYGYDRAAKRTGIVSLLRDVSAAGLVLRDLQTRESSLEDIFVGLVREDA